MQIERYPTRDRSYGIWHRARSISRFLGHQHAASLTMADLDSVLFTEYDHHTKLPLCLIEVAVDIGQDKATGVIMNLARMANLPAYVVLYSHAHAPNPSNHNWPDIDHFRVRRVWPRPERQWRELSPGDWASALLRIRDWQLRRFHGAPAANDPEY